MQMLKRLTIGVMLHLTVCQLQKIGLLPNLYWLEILMCTLEDQSMDKINLNMWKGPIRHLVAYSTHSSRYKNTLCNVFDNFLNKKSMTCCHINTYTNGCKLTRCVSRCGLQEWFVNIFP